MLANSRKVVVVGFPPISKSVSLNCRVENPPVKGGKDERTCHVTKLERGSICVQERTWGSTQKSTHISVLSLLQLCKFRIKMNLESDFVHLNNINFDGAKLFPMRSSQWPWAPLEAGATLVEISFRTLLDLIHYGSQFLYAFHYINIPNTLGKRFSRISMRDRSVLIHSPFLGRDVRILMLGAPQ